MQEEKKKANILKLCSKVQARGLNSLGSAAASLLLLSSRQRLNTVGSGGRAQIYVSGTVLIRWSDHVARQVLQVELLRQLLIQLIDASAFLGGSLHIGRIKTLSVCLGSL